MVIVAMFSYPILQVSLDVFDTPFMLCKSFTGRMMLSFIR
jgi:hypothetical protein